MVKKFIGLGLIAGLLVTSLSADTFKKGDNVIVEKGSMLCYSKESLYAIDALNRVDTNLELLIMDAEDAKEENKKFIVSFPTINLQKASHCAFFNSNSNYKFYRYSSEGKYALLDSEDYWIAAYSNSLKKDTSTPETNSPTYSFLGIDDLEAFPSDYIGKLSYLKCKRSRPEEMKNGGYKIMAKCAKSDGSYGFGGNNPFKIEIQTSSRDIARAIAKSKEQEKLFLGTVKKNTEQFAIAKHIFTIHEVKYK
jgi:hypothetical protein